MDLVESEFYISKILEGKLSKDILNSSGPLLYEMHNRLGLSYDDVCFICYNCPEILTQGIYKFVANLNELSRFLNLKMKEIKYLIFKHPHLCLANFSNIEYKIKLISTIFAVSYKEALRLMYIFPELIYIKKENIVYQIEMLSDCLDEYGFALRKHFKNEPRLIFITKDCIEKIKEYFMKNFSLSSNDVLNLIKTVPSILFDDLSEIQNKFNKYYPKLFIKRDVKEILSSCPEFVLLEPSNVVCKIKEIKNIFSISEKNACEIIRKEPNLLFVENLSGLLNNFLKYNISFEYLKNYPSLIVYPDITIPIKFMLTRILKRDKDFYKLTELDTSALLSRMAYVDFVGDKEYEYLFESEDEFCDRYKIDSRLLHKLYKPELGLVKNIVEKYVNYKSYIKNWSDILLPNINKLERFLWSKQENVFDLKNYENVYYRKREKEFVVFLNSLQLNSNEIGLILAKNPNFSLYAQNDIKSIYEYLKKLGFNHENIFNLLIRKCNMFSYPIKDLECVVKDICEYNACEEKEAVLKYL